MQGDVQTILSALGSAETDEQFGRAVDFIGGEFDTEDYRDMGDDVVYLVWPERGVRFLIEDDVLDSVFFRIQGVDGRSSYAEVEQLVDGVTRETTRAELLSLFGEPVRSGAAFVIFAAGDGYVHFEFDDAGELKLVTVMKVIPGGVDVEEPASGNPTRAEVTGQIESFLDAIGCAAYSPKHVALIVLAGTTMETKDKESDGAKWLYQNFPKTGVLLQFKDNVLVGILIRIHGDEDEWVYPDPANLIAGLALPATRDAVTSFMGSPDQASQYMDLYSLEERYVRFDYEDGLCFSVAITLPGVTA